MDIFGAVRGHFKAIQDEAAFDLNVCIQNQDGDDVVGRMIKAIRRYHDASSHLSLLDTLEGHYNRPQQAPVPQEVVDEN